MRIHTSQPKNDTGGWLKPQKAQNAWVSHCCYNSMNIDKPTAGFHLTDAAIRIILQPAQYRQHKCSQQRRLPSHAPTPPVPRGAARSPDPDSLEHADTTQMLSHHRDLPYTPPSLTGQMTRPLCPQSLRLCRATRNAHAPAAAAACSGASAAPAFRLSSASVRAPPRSTLVRKYSPAR